MYKIMILYSIGKSVYIVRLLKVINLQEDLILYLFFIFYPHTFNQTLFFL